MIEEWRSCFDGHYSVSSLGRVRREIAGRGTRCGILNPGRAGAGYEQVSPCVGGKQKPVYVHQLVAAAFLGPCPAGKEVNHKDTVKTNNRAENLEYVTRSEQMQHARSFGLHPLTRLTPEMVRTIRESPRYRGFRVRLAREYGVSASTIDRVLKRTIWRHVA